MDQSDLTTATLNSANDIAAIARQIAVKARTMSSEIDKDRRLPEELVTACRRAG
jgi:hypothetical protein